MTYSLGAGSRAALAGVHPQLAAVVERAIQISGQDFTVTEGLRSVAAQRANVAKGTSKTMNSMHLPQADGKADAVDLMPFVGKPVWDWERIYPIAWAMDRAATELGVDGHIRWGGAWGRRLSQFGGDASAYKREAAAYCARHPGSDFLDGPHFEWRDDDIQPARAPAAIPVTNIPIDQRYGTDGYLTPRALITGYIDAFEGVMSLIRATRATGTRACWSARSGASSATRWTSTARATAACGRSPDPSWRR